MAFHLYLLVLHFKVQILPVTSAGIIIIFFIIKHFLIKLYLITVPTVLCNDSMFLRVAADDELGLKLKNRKQPSLDWVWSVQAMLHVSVQLPHSKNHLYTAHQ